MVLQLLEAVAQILLILLQIAHTLLALLAAAALVALVLALLEGLVAQLLLLADHVAKLVQRLIHLAVAALAGLRHLQVFQHLLHLFEQLLGGVLVAGARQPLHAVDHVVEVLLPHHLGVRDRADAPAAADCCFICSASWLQEIVQRRTQVVGELLDLFVAGAALQRLLQRVLRRASAPCRHR